MMRQVGGGILVAAGLIVGTVVGWLYGESSIGFIAGLVIGLIGAGLVALWDTRRR